ncbi:MULTISPECIES: ABC-F family ATP-binding cassette domain-containing protein [Gammaproteobacteria]|uniref:ABC transporter ATP-binding protein n=5 Tax=Enterobacterales TaxID=91347 RepID=A0A8D5WPN8_KLEAE|nr:MULTISPECIES: ATP-binding cassette domain-containing protein [Gammaproteobacteria]ECP5087231.1 ABC-F family ATP-binding cassette domain-containing protein [Salmonella enterica subsp. enterica serovar Typhimurium]EEG7992565.1 ABC-F family ATP-binding cassette domain-containing protein [Salmonella enterica subsp. enterica serovar 4,[5],12:i:-]EHI4065241.1 ABC-F family ATP-binding cassette domain-containing protein [Salmonella enterica]EHJ3795394.1 ABC-F family ATP-binding cassette domain-conta
MANFLQLQSVSFKQNNGETLFSDLSGTFTAKITALIGRNGVGKTVLAQLCAGILLPTSGTILNSDHVFYLSQHYVISEETTVAELLGIDHVMAALRRIEQGSVLEEDFAIVGDQWAIETEALSLLAKLGLPNLLLDSPAMILSGGEQMRIRIAVAFLSQKEILILDEPSNHLDHSQKEKLWDLMQLWTGTIILISHDRFFLNQLTNIVELTPSGLEWFTGSYEEYRIYKAEAAERAVEILNSVKSQEKQRQAVIQQQIERQQKRTSAANKARGNQNQAKILMDAQKNRSDLTSGKTQQKLDRIQKEGQSRIDSARANLDTATSIHLHQIPALTNQPDIAVKLENIQLPFMPSDLEALNQVIRSGERIAIVGDNGIGKTLLLKVIAGSLSPESGQATHYVKTAYLDQHLTILNPQQSVLEQISQGRTKDEISQLRMQLAQLGLTASHIERESQYLSGGEKLKAALAMILYDQTPSGLLLLDEPSNHLDLESLSALEAMLNHYQGTLIIISHDATFLSNIGIESQLHRAENGWIKYPFQPKF